MRCAGRGRGLGEESAHAGRDFASGRNAVAAACRLAERLDALNGQRDGVTLNIARIDGGAPLNVVPDLAVVRFMADEVLVMKDGDVVEQASVADILERPREDYTKRLLGAIARGYRAAA